ncbi:MAG: ATP-binding cassette domain-containing protein, partial [Oscillospiraceae bacterium]
MFEVLDEPVQPPDSPDALSIERCEGDVRLAGVSFSYRPEQTLIENLHLHARPGSRVAIVGPTGCGKTTIINLLMRFYDVREGTIAIDGIDTWNITRDSLRSMYGRVLQETWLTSGTVRENIAYGKPDATEQE